MRARGSAALLTALAVALSGCFGPAENQPPSAHASASIAQAAVGEEVIFTGAAVDTDGSIVRFEWDFDGDGAVDFTNATRGTAAHAYSRPGVFVAKFTATDDRGANASAPVVVSVIAKFTISADWGSDEGFLIGAAPGLEAGSVHVKVVPSGASAPYEFSQGAGLVQVDDTTYRVALPLSSLQPYSVTRVEVLYNGTVGGERVFRAVPYFGSENDTSLAFRASLSEVRALPGSNTTLSYTGALRLVTSGAAAVAGFEGSGTSRSTYGDASSNSTADFDLSSVAWNHSIGASNGSFASLDYSWSGQGTIVSQTSTGFTTNLSISLFEGTRVRGNLTYERAEGAGTYLGDLPATAGTAEFLRLSGATFNFADGNGFPRLALQVAENLTLNGTYGGTAFFETNLTERIVATSDALLHNDLFVSWNTTGRVGTTNLSDAGSRYLDTDGDGVYNPDVRPPLAFDGQYFSGLAPAALEEGDAFTVRNALGAFARLTVGPPRTEVLLAEGFTAVAVDVAAVGGSVEGGGLVGAVSADVVVSGPHAGLRLRSREDLSSPTGSFSSSLTLQGRGA